MLEEGKPYKVGKISFTGAQRFKPDELAVLIPMKPGQTYSNETERAAADLIDHKYSRLGYADYMVRPILTPNYKTHTVDRRLPDERRTALQNQ